ncbi:MAG: hypothetical protein Q9217_002877 [Psora testacea]
MAPTEHGMPDVDLPKHSLLSMGKYDGQSNTTHCNDTITRASESNGIALNGDQSTKRARRKRAPKNDSLIALICQWTVEHQVGLSVNLLLLHALAHICFPRARPSTRKFYQLSYHNPRTGKYAVGWDDFYMVIYSIIMLTGLRAATLDYVLVSLAQILGVTKKKEKARFAEQAWVLIYDSVFWSLGMWIYSLRYVILRNQLGPVRILIEARQLAKILKYLRFKLACDIAFGVFMLVWFIARHVLYLRVVHSVYHHIPEEITYGCYSGGTHDLRGPSEIPDSYHHLVDPFQNPEGTICWNDGIKWAFIYMLLALQVLLLLWFGMIIKVAVKVLRGGEAEDSRSDDEEEEGEDYDIEAKQNSICSGEVPIQLPPLEEEVGVEAINLGSQRSSPVRRFRKGGGVSSGVTLHSDRKELLGRIGCDGGHD